jgi:peptidyl-prolyl cis-trans isomerase A (cyclophilin A)
MKAQPSPSARVVDGFSEALQRMKPGDRQICYLPCQLACGAARRRPIPPAADLLFEIELVSMRELASRIKTPPAREAFCT